MSALSTCGRLLLILQVCVLPARLLAQDSDKPNPQRRTVGAPQVLEIPPQTALPPLNGPDAAQGLAARGEATPDYGFPYSGAQALPDLSTTWPDAAVPPLEAQDNRSYLGVLYATAEDGPEGVKVLSVVEGSPADQAGFEGANAPPAASNGLLKAAIVVLAMSPAGPFAIPLVIAHDLYTNRHPPGDLIVGVADTPVRDAQEFSQALRRYRPGDSVPFKVIREGELLQITVQLEREPASLLGP